MIERYSDWLNCPNNLYVSYTNTPSEILVQLITKYGFLFDDNYWYWIPKARNKKKQQLTRIVKRSPIWTYPSKSVQTESRKPYRKGKQTKLKVA